MTLSSLINQIPWLLPALEWMLGMFVAFLAWVIVSFPAHLLEGVFDRTRGTLKLVLLDYGNVIKNDFSSFETRIGERFQKFFDCHAVRASLSWSRKPWCIALLSTNYSLRRFRKTLARAATTLRRHVSRAQSLERQVRGIEAHFHKISTASTDMCPAGPPGDAIRPAISAIFSIVLVVALVTVNVGVLNKILQELGIGLFTVAGPVKLYHIIAFLLTLIEAGLGVTYGYTKTEVRDNVTFQIGQFFPMIGAAMLAFVEGFFYSRLGQVAVTQGISFGPYEFGMDQALFLLGFTLPIALFGLGDVMFRSIVRLFQSRSISRFENRLKAFRRRAQIVDEYLEKLEKHWIQTRETGGELIDNLPVVSTQREQEMLGQFNRVIGELQDVLHAKPQKAELPLLDGVPASRTYYAFRIGIAIIITMLAIAFGTFLQITVLPTTDLGINATQAAIIAASKSVSMLVAGLYAQSPSPATDPAGNTRLEFGRAYPFAIILSGLVVALGLGFDGYLLFWGGIEPSDQLGWVIVLAADIVLVLLGRDLPSMLALLMPAVWMIFEAFWLALRAAAVLAGYIIVAALSIIGFVLRILSAPVTWYFGMRNRAHAQSSTASS